MNLLGAILGGAIGAIVGGVVWALVAYATHYEIGWIAWGVGLAAGTGAAMGSRGEGGAHAGAIAAVLAVAAILLAKYAVVHLLVSDSLKGVQKAIDEHPIPGVEDNEYWTSHIADQLVVEKAKRGEHITWPAGVDPEEAERESDYPKQLWADAKARWTALTPQAKSDYRDNRAAFMAQQLKSTMSALQSEAASEGYIKSFDLFDLVFGLLAIATAFKVGSGEMPGMQKS
jgi:hypothetical protein